MNSVESVICVLILQVLVLKVTEEKDQRLILERENGQNLDWSFQSLDNHEVYNVVKAHKSIVLKYSPYLRNICHLYANRGAQKNCWYLNMQLIQLIYWIFIFSNFFCYSFIHFSISVLLSLENN